MFWNTSYKKTVNIAQLIILLIIQFSNYVLSQIDQNYAEWTVSRTLTSAISTMDKRGKKVLIIWIVISTNEDALFKW